MRFNYKNINNFRKQFEEIKEVFMQVLKKKIYDAIEDNAIKLFKQFSYEGANIDLIADKANISTGNIYRYYNNKKAIYDKVTGKAYKMLDEAADQFLEKKDIKTEEIIEKIIDVYKKEKSSTIILLGVKNTINKELLEKYEKIFVKAFEKGEDKYLNEVYAKSMFYAFRIMIDNDHTTIKLNNSLRKYVQVY
jgi:AcrR family transcriptional regulator